jgi:hypothetical protein
LRANPTNLFDGSSQGESDGPRFAHELAHRFLVGHTDMGILKHLLDQRALISKHNDALFFSPDQVRVLRLRLEGLSP